MLGLQASPTVGIVRDPKERGSEEPIIEEIRIMKRILIALLAAVALCGVAAYSWADGARHGHDTDPVAYVRFASVYRSFKDIGEFMVELEELIKERKTQPHLKPGDARQRRE